MDDVRNCFIPFFILVFCFFTSYGLGANVTLSRGEDENITLYAQWSGEPIIARVSNDGGRTWTMHSYLINNNYDPSNDSPDQHGAFDYANTLSGEVIIETVLEHHPRYTLAQGFSFNGPSTVTLRTTQDEQWNPTTDRFTSTIYRGRDFGSLITFEIFENGEAHIENIILDGGYDFSTSTGHSCDYDGGLVNMESGTLYITDATLQNSYTTGWGGAIYTAGELYLNGTVTFTGCTADEDGGAIYAEGTVTLSGDYSELTLGGTQTGEGCSAVNGGGVYCGGEFIAPQGSIIEITNCTANNLGGGIYASGELYFHGSATFTNCTATGNGGGIYAENAACLLIQQYNPSNPSLTLENCHAGASGGGAYFKDGIHTTWNAYSSSINPATITATGCTAGVNGGGFYLSGGVDLYGDPATTGCYITGCSAGTGKGGGIYLHSEPNFAGLIIVEGNTHGSGSDAGLSDSYFRGDRPNYLLVNLMCYDGNGRRDLTTVEVGRPELGGAHKMYGLRMGDGQLVVNGEGRVDLYDIQGRLLESVRVSGDQNKVPLPSLASGVYLLCLTSQGNVRVQKIVINKR